MFPTTYANRWSVSVYSWCVYYVTPLQHHRPSGPQPERAQIDPNYLHCSTTGKISSLLSIIRSPTAFIKPLLVSRSTTHNSGWNMPANDLTNSSVERIKWISSFQNCASCKTSSKLHSGHLPSWYDASERQYFWHCTPIQNAQPEPHN